MQVTFNINDSNVPEIAFPVGDPETLREIGRRIVRRFYEANNLSSSFDLWDDFRVPARTLASNRTKTE